MANYTLNIKNNNATNKAPMILSIRWKNNNKKAPLKINTGVSIEPEYWQNEKTKPYYKTIFGSTKTVFSEIGARQVKKFPIISCPYSLIIDSGWNCTP